MRRWFMFGAVLAMTLLAVVPAAAQSEITISLAVNSFFSDVYKERIIPAFEAANPGVKVHLVILDSFGNPMNPSDGVEDYLDDAAEYLTGADVVPLDTSLQRTVTRAGYLLDLAPLADTAASLNAAEFYPAAFDAFRWDGGLWGLPVSVDLIQVYYDKQAFDEAGLAYPNANWTAADYANAIRVLTPLSSDGTPSNLALRVFGEASQYFFASFAGDVLNDTVLPNVPDYSSPTLYDVADAWVQLNQEGYLTPSGDAVTFQIGGDAEPQPLVIGSATFANVGPSYVDRIGVAPLPGNQTVMTASGYGVSAGTRYPDAAYALVKFLTNSSDAVTLSFGGEPARRTVTPSTEGLGGRGGFRPALGSQNMSAEVQAAIDAAMETARPARDFAFADGLEGAMYKVLDGSTTLEMALQEIEAGFLADLQAAELRRSTPLIVDAPPAPVVLEAGEVGLNFAVSTFVNPLPNTALWEQLAAEFAAQDPQVGAVTISGEMPFGPNGAADLSAEYDCYVSSNNPVTSGAVLDTLLSLDPLLQSDTAFDPNDLYPGILAQLQRDSMTWGIPIALTPQALDYDPALLAAAGVPEPANGWTVGDFELALRLLSDASGGPGFVPGTFNTTYLSTLIAAYGGLPYDGRTQPATLNFADTNSVAAIQQVLDLIVAGYITYEPFTTGERGGFSLSELQQSAISTASVGTGGVNIVGGGAVIAVRARGPEEEEDSSTASVRRYVPYPSGTTLNGASYSVIAGYISAATANVDPCYRWLRFVAEHTELFEGMPVSRAQVNDPALDTSAGADNAAFYRSFGALLDSSNTVIVEEIPPVLGLPSETYWLLKTFDDYVAANGEIDLADRLAEAQQFALEFRECAAGVGEFIPGPDTDFQARAQELVNCAVSVDPSAAGAFQF
jgi:ABC-type glycerol-3-phosphate transport system substrate-binding protein